MLVICQYLRHFYKTIKIKLIKEGTTSHYCYYKLSCVGAIGCGSISNEENERTPHVGNLPVSEAFLQNYLDLSYQGRNTHRNNAITN
jgi:hypothetical protein